MCVCVDMIIEQCIFLYWSCVRCDSGRMLDENYVVNFPGSHFQPQQAYKLVNKVVYSGALLEERAAEKRRVFTEE